MVLRMTSKPDASSLLQEKLNTETTEKGVEGRNPDKTGRQTSQYPCRSIRPYSDLSVLSVISVISVVCF
jgi:hypothetical protein